MLSPIYQVLIFIEHFGKLTQQDFSGWSDAKFRGVLGKLEVQGWVKKEIHDREFAYILSPQGKAWINQQLERLHQKEKEWDGKYRIVVFSIPERSRTLRDRLRRALRKIGFEPYEKGIWISLYDERDKILKIIDEIGIGHHFVYFESKFLAGSQNALLKKVWHISQIRGEYKRFINEAKKLLSRQKPKDQAFKIKKLILDFSLILKKDPFLPREFLPSNWPRDEAFEWYRKLKAKLYPYT